MDFLKIYDLWAFAKYLKFIDIYKTIKMTKKCG